MENNAILKFRLFYLLILFSFFNKQALSCTNLIITKSASADGSTMMVYTNDGEWLYKLDRSAAKDHKPGDSIEFKRGNRISGKIAQVPHTYALLGFAMNEHQVAVGETTFTGREELWNHSKYLKYWHLMRLALERAKTAREAIRVMTSLVEEYGYGSEGESFSIIDPNEAWILEMIGTGEGGEGAIWVALKIPDGTVCAHANMSRIGEFHLNDPENCLYSKNVVSFATERGYYDPEAGEPFRFNDAYNPSSPDRLKYCESRVWSLFRRISPSLNLSPDYHRGVQGVERYPLWIKPDKKLSLKNVIDLMRDHYEGTDFDMTKGIDAGPFGNPNRWRPLQWDSNGIEYSWERPISTYNTAFSFIAQARSWLPNDIGGIVWYGVDDTYFTCYIPLFCSITEVPQAFTVGDIKKFSWESAWWVFNFVSNYCNIKYSYMIKDMQQVQTELEEKFISDQTQITQEALGLKNKKRQKYLTEYSVIQGLLTYERWVELAEHLITKYNDGYVKNEKGRPKEVGYPNEYKEKIIKYCPGKFEIPDWNKVGRIKDMPF